MSSADEKEPMPVSDDHPAAQDLVLEDIIARKLVGVQKYGTALKPLNGRNNLMDVYQESLDLVVYLRNELHRQQLFEAELGKIVDIINAYYLDDTQMWMSLEDVAQIQRLISRYPQPNRQIKRVEHGRTIQGIPR